MVARGHRQARGSWSFDPRARCQWHWPASPFCATGRAVCLDIAAIDLPGLGKPAFLGQSRKDASPDAPTALPVPAIRDRRRWAVFRRAIGPAATALEHVNDARNHPPIIDPSRSRLVLRQVRLDRSPSLIRQPEQQLRHSKQPLAQRRLSESG